MSTQPSFIRVMIVDDQEMVRSALEVFFETCDDLQLVGSAADSQEAIRLCNELQPNVVLMDLMLSGKPDGILAARMIRQSMPQICVIALSSFFSPELFEEAFRAGITSYLAKSMSIDELAEAIREGYGGKTVISPEIALALEKVKKQFPPL